MNDLTDTEAVLCRYRYDALDRLAGVDSGTAEPVWRFYQKSRLSVEIQGALRRSVFQMGDRLLAEHRLSGSTGQSDLLGTDRQRSVLHTQDSQGRQSIAYSPYGHCPTANTLPGFNGERRDPVTGHYLLGNGYRAYNPVLMRFNQPDSFSPFGRGGLNAYAYCQGDPVNRRDPSGHNPILPMLTAGVKYFDDLPDLVIETIIKNTFGKELDALSGMSLPMKSHVSRFSGKLQLDFNTAGALEKFSSALKGEVRGVPPDMLRHNAAYKAAVEESFQKIGAGFQNKYDAFLPHYRETIAGLEEQFSVLKWSGDFAEEMAKARRLYRNAGDQATLDLIEFRKAELDLALSRINKPWGEFIRLRDSIRSNLKAH